jgi:Lrp/AsnC family transcriptional regulator, leucine-responsive regulatory protein
MATNLRSNVDSTNLRLLAELQENARLSLAELGRRVGLSSPAVADRLARLEEEGVIRGYRADIDPAAAGRAFEVSVLVELIAKDRATVEAFERRIAELEAVVQCRRMFGVPDYIIEVAVEDALAYEAFYMNELAELPGLGRVTSQILMKLVKAPAGGSLPTGAGGGGPGAR